MSRRDNLAGAMLYADFLNRGGTGSPPPISAHPDNAQEVAYRYADAVMAIEPSGPPSDRLEGGALKEIRGHIAHPGIDLSVAMWSIREVVNDALEGPAESPA